MNPIRTNKPVFFGDNGEVLKSGQIYIGQPNQWPLSFPKTVTFQDSAGSQFTASQPLATNDQGRITYNGKSIMALVDGDYSILVRDRNGVTVGEGYTPFVSNTDTGGGTTEGVTQVGLLLSDIKQFNVTPGETVRNVGKSTTLDGLGADWLVVSNTGSPGDDVDLIDFDNGTQGQRIDNVVYSKQVGTETGQIPTVVYEEVTMDGGDFTADPFTLKCMKIGRVVTLWTDIAPSHPSDFIVTTGTDSLPSEFRPPSGTIHKDSKLNVNYLVTVTVSGISNSFQFAYNSITDGSNVSRTGPGISLSITYGV